jgi:hypothetical protein
VPELIDARAERPARLGPLATGIRAGVHSVALALDSGPDGLQGGKVRDLFPCPGAVPRPWKLLVPDVCVDDERRTRSEPTQEQRTQEGGSSTGDRHSQSARLCRA